jgi:D-psicose/D-tagatose/L-ribulose 3-epimerase
VDHRNVHALVDTYHLVTEIRDYAEEIDQVSDRLWGLHACENDRSIPGNGLVPWDTIFQKLKQIEFSGYLVFETYNSFVGNPPGSFAYERGMFHNPCPDGEEFVTKGLAFLKKKARCYKI